MMTYCEIKTYKKSDWVFVCSSDDESFMYDIISFANQIKSKQNNIDNNFIFFANEEIGVIKLQK